jgi:membrane protein implicated in regulation of membrane protease activity
MNCRRRHGSKPTLALWMLVAAADVALLAAAAGPLLMLLIGVSLTLVVGAVVGVRMLARRETTQSDLIVAGVRMLTQRDPVESEMAVRRRT